MGGGAGKVHRVSLDNGSKLLYMKDVGRVSDSLSEKVFRERIDQIEQSIKFCNFKISKGRELSITEIV